MARYFITHQDISLDCGTITVNMRSGTIDHLWLLYTTIKPAEGVVEDISQPGPRPHHLNFKLYIEGVVEQEEPGNTIQHTFRFPWPAGRDILWFYTINMHTVTKKASRSPIFAYQFNNTPFWYESWLPGPSSLNSFQYFFDNVFNPAAATINEVVFPVISFNFSGTFTGGALLGNGLSEVTAPFQSCGATFRFTIPANDGDPPYAAPSVEIRLRNSAVPSDDCSIIFTTGSPTQGPFEVPPPANHFVIHVGPGEHTVDLNQILTVRHTAFPSSCPPGLVSATLIAVASGSHSPAFIYTHEYAFGTVTIGRIDQVPTDVSRDWRRLRLNPRLP